MKIKEYFRKFKNLTSLGALSLAVQISAMRELLITLNGNEIIIGIFYTTWLFAVALGARLSLKIKDSSSKYLTFIYPLIALLTFVVFVKMRVILGVSVWEEINFMKCIILISLANLPFGILGGILFVKFINLAKNENRLNALNYGYTAESLGSVFCGILITLLLLLHVKSFYVLFFIGFLFYYLNNLNFKTKQFFAWSSFLLYLTSSSAFIFIDKDDYDFIIETPFQELALKKEYSNLHLYSNAKIVSTYPRRYNPDALTALLLSQTKGKIKTVLVSGLGQEELINSLSYYDLDIYYHIYDKDYSKHIYPKIKAKIGLNDNKTNIITKNIRSFLKENPKKFDLILVAQNGPSVLANNSYYSDEFFKLAKKALSFNGILALPLEQEENFLDKELALYGSSILMTLENNFNYTTIIPGKIHYFFACNIVNNLSTDADTLVQRYEKLKAQDSIYPAKAFYSLLDRRRIRELDKLYRNQTLLSPKELINKDSKPSTYLLNNIVTMRKHNIQSAELIAKLKKNSNKLTFFLLFLLFIIRFIYVQSSHQHKKDIEESNALIFQGISGFTSLSIYLIMLYIFQIKFSQLYSYLGLLSASYMIGLCIGALSIKHINKKFKIQTIFKGIILSQITYLLLLPVFIYISANVFAIIAFVLGLIIAGFLGGCSYPCAELIINKTSASTIKNLEEFDHIGASLSGISVSLFFMPFIGITSFIKFLIFSWLCLLALTIQIKYFKVKKVIIKAKDLSWFALVLCLSLFSLNTILKDKVDKDFDTSKIESKFYAETKNLAGSDKINGYGGPLNIAIALNDDNTISSVQLKENNETPYYIRHIDDLLEQYNGLDICNSSELSEVDAISGSTITSNAILENLINYSGQQDRCNGKVRQRNVFSLSRHKTLFILLGFLFISLFAKVILRKEIIRTIYLAILVICMGAIYQIQYSSIEIIRFLKDSSFSVSFGLLVALITILFGRHYCAYLCPYGAMSELAAKLPSKFKIIIKRQSILNIKYIILVVIIFLALFFKTLHLQEPLTIFFSGLANPIYFLSILLIVSSVFVPRFWCKILCPAGAFMSALSKISLRLDNLIFKGIRTTKKIERSKRRRYAYVSKDNSMFCFACICIMVIILYNLSVYNIDATDLKQTSLKSPISDDEVHETKETKQIAKPTPGLKSVAIDSIKSKIQRRQLSDHEAMFYEKLY